MHDTQPIPDAFLEIIEPSGRRRRVKITANPFLIGRSAEASNHLQLPDKRVSRRSAALVFSNGQFHLEGREQRHGISVNGEPIDIRPLRDGDRITLGIADTLQLTFFLGRPQEDLSQVLSRLEQTSTLDSTARAIRPFSLLLKANALLHSHLSLEDVLSQMIDHALALTDADRGLLLESDSRGSLRPLVARQRDKRSLPPESIQPSRTAMAQALKQHRSIIEEDVDRAGAALQDVRSVVAQQLRAVIAIPLYSLSQLRASDATVVSTAGQLVGLLYLDSHRPAVFSRLQRETLEALAREVASVLDNARLFKRERERQRIEQELDIAREIQQALLPRSFHQFPYLQVSGINRPCFAVGGDYFDLMELSPDRAAFVIADVSGKGLGAALVTAMLQGTFSAMTLGQEPARVFAHVNRFICSHSEIERYATLFFGILDSDGRLEFINAGHPSPLLIHDGRAASSLPAECLPLGLLPESDFQSRSVTLDPGDTLVLFTDGINEAETIHGEQLGIEGLRDVVTRHASASVEKLEAGVLSAVEDFTRGNSQADDITLLILRYRGLA
ncbi:MAG: SpoIIE family protein phosphatase [Terriglobia bacterium]